LLVKGGGYKPLKKHIKIILLIMVIIEILFTLLGIYEARQIISAPDFVNLLDDPNVPIGVVYAFLIVPKMLSGIVLGIAVGFLYSIIFAIWTGEKTDKKTKIILTVILLIIIYFSTGKYADSPSTYFGGFFGKHN
jgi:hypothetical protein